MASGRYETSLAIVQQAAVECGLSSPAAAFASTDPDVILLRTLLNSCGRELCTMRPWRHLLKSGSFTAAAAAVPPAYGVNALAADFNYPIDDTFWNATDDQQLFPADEATWERYITTASSPDPSAYRLEGNSIWLYAPSATDTITYRYVSRYWVKPNGQTSPTASSSTADTDTLYHWPEVLTRLLKLRFRQARGEDTVSVLVDFEHTYAMAAAREASAGTLSLSGRRGLRVLSGSNFKDGNWG
jgi:hypothetical protein